MLKLKVPDMTCGHCVSVVEKAIKAIDPNAAVKADLAAKTVTVETSAAAGSIAQAVDAAGYANSAG